MKNWICLCLSVFDIIPLQSLGRSFYFVYIYHFDVFIEKLQNKVKKKQGELQVTLPGCWKLLFKTKLMLKTIFTTFKNSPCCGDIIAPVWTIKETKLDPKSRLVYPLKYKDSSQLKRYSEKPFGVTFSSQYLSRYQFKVRVTWPTVSEASTTDTKYHVSSCLKIRNWKLWKQCFFHWSDSEKAQIKYWLKVHGLSKNAWMDHWCG